VSAGRLRAGLKNEPWPSTEITHHPVTGADMVGRTMPGWEGMVLMALRLHRLFPGFVLVGWDIALTPAGPVITEANTPPGASMNRQGSFGGLVGTRLFALLAFHAWRWLEHNEAPDSRWRFKSLPARG
jgi:hypothetical protein